MNWSGSTSRPILSAGWRSPTKRISRPRSAHPCANYRTTRRKSVPSTKSHPLNTPHENEHTYGLINTAPAFVLCTVWGMAPMLDLPVWIGAVPVFPIRQALTASISAASARPSPALLVPTCCGGSVGRTSTTNVLPPGSRFPQPPAPIRSSVPPCSGQSRLRPSGGREDAASLDRPSARRLCDLAVGTEECSRRGSNQRMDQQNRKTPSIEIVDFRRSHTRRHVLYGF